MVSAVPSMIIGGPVKNQTVVTAIGPGPNEVVFPDRTHVYESMAVHALYRIDCGDCDVRVVVFDFVAERNLAALLRVALKRNLTKFKSRCAFIERHEFYG